MADDFDPFADDDPFFTDVALAPTMEPAKKTSSSASSPKPTDEPTMIPEPTQNEEEDQEPAAILPTAEADDAFFESEDGKDDDEIPNPEEQGRQYTITLPNWLGWITPQYYERFCDVNTFDIGKRLLAALFPYTGHFTKMSAANGEIYGPMWITMTYICLLGVMSYVAMKFNSVYHAYIPSLSSGVGDNEYDFRRVLFAAAVVIAYTVIVPAVFWIVSLVASFPLSFVTILDVVAYSLLPPMLTLPFCIIPYTIVGYLAWTTGALFGLIHVAVCIAWLVHQKSIRWLPALVLMILLIPIHVLWTFVIKLLILGYSIDFSVGMERWREMLDITLKQ
ncbi:protein YIPF1 [Carpediemonas membranifera]|uniref:Protein YIPF1 n=1 Tax=Carpediemonas membranifera TaxID=201153 RepID=A0A8J6EAC9_9EUKA|nr:protein YIPF1 [Carpediemonas membranifera]|eukprot:KAG9394525.1 protein YIPF1 [Carpediemonas membranifera]